MEQLNQLRTLLEKENLLIIKLEKLRKTKRRIKLKKELLV